jgi:hypothetical protein
VYGRGAHNGPWHWGVTMSSRCPRVLITAGMTVSLRCGLAVAETRRRYRHRAEWVVADVHHRPAAAADTAAQPDALSAPHARLTDRAA